MDLRSIKVLELDKIINMLKNKTNSKITQDAIDGIEPSIHKEEVKEFLQQTSDALDVMMRKGNPPMAEIRDIRLALDRVTKASVLSQTELLDIAHVLKLSREIKRYYMEEGSIPDTSLNEYFNLIKPIKKLEDEIFRCIVDHDEISDNASPELKRIRREIVNSNSKIKEHLNSIIRSSAHQKHLQDNIVTIRDGRYVIPVKQEYRNEINGIMHYQSATGSTVFIEPMVVVNENNKIRELKVQEQEEILKILSILTSMVAQNLEDVRLNLNMCVQIDMIFAKAKLSMDMNGVEPKINDLGRVKLIKARHPLIEKDKVVPIDIFLGNKFNILVITGPNTGGKTVTLKTIGLLSLMAQCGLHIPVAEESEISIFENVFADIGDEQSIEQSLSTFSAHMSNMIRILKEVDNKTLVLMDELGSGTDPVEGSSLAIAILEYLKGKGCKAVATTHYSQLKTYAISSENVENASCEFSVETLRPTYRLLIGIPGKSNALAICRRLGLNEDIVQMAGSLVSEEDVKIEDVISDLEYNKKIAEEERQKATELTNEIKNLKEELKQKGLKMEEERQKIVDRANEDARVVLLEAKKTADESLKEIRKISMQLHEQMKAQNADIEKRKIEGNLEQVQDNIIKSIRGRHNNKQSKKEFNVGDSVLIISLNQSGIIMSKPDSENKVMVQAGIMKISVAASNLAHIEKQKQKNSKKQVLAFAAKKVKGIKERIDMRGYRVEEALDELDKYLDDACIAGVSQVTIVHGKGTGALRTAIHEYLRKHPHVSKFRIGEYGEGDSGITVVEIK